MKIKELFILQDRKKAPISAVILNLALVTAVVFGLFWLSLKRVDVTLDFTFLKAFAPRITKGFLMTICLSSVSLITSLIIGLVSAAGRSFGLIFIRYLCDTYVKFIRGTPLIMQIYLFFYIIGTAWGVNNRFLAGVLILSVFEGAYISEIIRGSLLSMDQSQLEAAQAVGFTKKQTMVYVIIPQLVARTLPALTGQLASIIKDSSLLSMIAVIELTQTMREISSTNFKLFECYFFLGLLYLCLTLPVSFLSSRLERRFHYEG